jgi:actin-like ATPase involved in cell morphogenesis
MYALGIDLGTTFTSAAVWRNGHAETASLGSRGPTIPSVVLLREDETFLAGEGASRRGMTEPHRVAREFKRRLGDTTPIMLGGVPYSADALTARLLRWVIDEVAKREGGKPNRVCVSHPANWGPYKTDLLMQAVRLAGLDEPVSFTTEPEAAAVFYAQQQRVEPGAIVAVYDLGGGTFDAAVLRKTAVGFEILGRPEGIERLGGIDFDAAVFSHVGRALGGKLEELDEEDPAVLAAVARLREECVQAKEALSSDTDVSIPVILPSLSTEIRLTRGELEAMVRPALHDSIDALRRALRSAGVSADQLHSVLLVGGSSRMPLVAQLVGAELNRPVAVDAHPKHAVALGAAWLASGAQATAPSPRSAGAQPEGTATLVPAVGAAAVGAPVAAPARAAATVPPQVPARAAPLARTAAGPPPVGRHPAGGAAPSAPAARPPTSSGKRLLVLVAAVLLAVVGGAAALAFALSGEPEPGPEGGTGLTSPTVDPLPADEQCTDAIKANPRWVCITAATMSSSELRIEYQFASGDAPFDINGGYHVHFYGANADGSDPAASIMGAHVPRNQQGNWYIEDQQPSVHPAGSSHYDAIGNNVKVCARIAQNQHHLVPDNTGDGTYVTGNCWPITRG